MLSLIACQNRSSFRRRPESSASDSEHIRLTVFVGVLLTVFFWGCGNVAWAVDAVPAAGYFPVLPFDASGDTVPQVVPVAANNAIEGVHAGVTRAIIIIHDETRDANRAVASLAALAGTSNASTLILAPQFLLPSDIARFANQLPDKGRAFAAWQMAGWPQGDDSAAASPHKGVSSFTVVDMLLMYLTDRKAFPDLQIITVAGYGAGANFVQRYAVFSLAADVVTEQDIDLRYLVADASSYLYLTANRPLGGRKGLGVPDIAACPAYNAYPYGFDKFNAYARRGGGNAAKVNYARRVVAYLNAPAADVFSDDVCAAGVQGKDNIARTANYKLYLQSLYGEDAAYTHLFLTAKDAKNDAAGLFGSVCGMAVLFGGGSCPSLSGEAR